MIYIYIDDHSIKLLCLTKTMLGQYTVHTFSKNHETSILKNGHPENIDLLASAIKEGLSFAQPQPIHEKDVFLILPQSSFAFSRQDVPLDTAEQAVLPLLKDKLTADTGIGETSCINYTKVQKGNEAIGTLFAIPEHDCAKFKQAFDLLGLHIKNIIPETLCYYKLFEKTLRDEKKELILYVRYAEDSAYGYLYDSLGLKDQKKYDFLADPKKGIKDLSESLLAQGTKLNRLILSGPGSNKVRQDLFTKEVGVWTNPLEKIIYNFYDQYVKVLSASHELIASLLEYDACLGGFIFDFEKGSFALSDYSNAQRPQGDTKKTIFQNTPSHHNGTGGGITKRDVAIFFISGVITASVIVGFTLLKTSTVTLPQLPKIGLNKPSPTPLTQASPTKAPTPTPSVDKAKLKVKILNGEGTPGFAGKVAAALKPLGYTDSVSGNADTFGYKKTEVQIKKGTRAAISPLLIKDLAPFVDISPEQISDLDEKENADIIIIAGEDFTLPQ